MAQLLTGYNTDSPGVFSFINGRIYLTNGFDRVKVWNGIDSAMRDAGIAAPTIAPSGPSTASGNGTAGVHLIRYRYLDSTSPAGTYRSNVSPTLSQTVTASGTDGQITFGIGVADDIRPSTDTKVDTIRIEMTVAAGSTFFVVTDVANTATTVVVSISDTLLALNEAAATYDTNLTSADTGSGHEQPPLGTIIAQCRDFVFIGGDLARTKTVGVTNGSPTITGTGFSTLWSTDRLIRVGTDAVANQITSATTTAITLTRNYAGSTNASVSAVIYAKNPNRIYWSAFKAGAVLPESWKPLVRARDVLNGSGDPLTGMIAFNGDLICAGRFSMERLVFVDDPGVGELNVIPGAFGVWNTRCFIAFEGTLFGWGPNGAWAIFNGMPQWISRDSDVSWTALVDFEQSIDFHGHLDPVNKVLRWFYTRTGDTAPKDSVAYDITGGRWTREQWRQSIDASLYTADGDGRVRAILSDSANTHTWFNTGVTDGVPSSSTGAYTVTTGSTSTIIQVTDSLPTGAGTDLTDVAVFRPATSETRIIASNTSSAFTVSSAWTSSPTSPAAGERMFVGSIPWSYTTGHWIAEGLHTTKEPSLWITFTPSTVSGTLRVSVFVDFSATAEVFTSGSQDTYGRGLTVTDGGSFVEVDIALATLQGFVRIPMTMGWRRAYQAKVEVLSPAGVVQILDIRFGLDSPRAMMKADKLP